MQKNLPSELVRTGFSVSSFFFLVFLLLLIYLLAGWHFRMDWGFVHCQKKCNQFTWCYSSVKGCDSFFILVCWTHIVLSSGWAKHFKRLFCYIVIHNLLIVYQAISVATCTVFQIHTHLLFFTEPCSLLN